MDFFNTESDCHSGSPLILADWMEKRRDFEDLCLAQGFSLKFEGELQAMERFLPNFPGMPFRNESHDALHLMRDGLQSGLYLSQKSTRDLSIDRLRAAVALYRHLADILAYTTRDYPDEIQSVLFLEILSGNFRVIQYWIDYPGDRDYAYRHVEGGLQTVLNGLSAKKTVDLTSWTLPISKTLSPVLSELAFSDWVE